MSSRSVICILFSEIVEHQSDPVDNCIHNYHFSLLERFARLRLVAEPDLHQHDGYNSIDQPALWNISLILYSSTVFIPWNIRNRTMYMYTVHTVCLALVAAAGFPCMQLLSIGRLEYQNCIRVPSVLLILQYLYPVHMDVCTVHGTLTVQTAYCTVDLVSNVSMCLE